MCQFGAQCRNLEKCKKTHYEIIEERVYLPGAPNLALKNELLSCQQKLRQIEGSTKIGRFSVSAMLISFKGIKPFCDKAKAELSALIDELDWKLKES